MRLAGEYLANRGDVVRRVGEERRQWEGDRILFYSWMQDISSGQTPRLHFRELPKLLDLLEIASQLLDEEAQQKKVVHVVRKSIVMLVREAGSLLKAQVLEERSKEVGGSLEEQAAKRRKLDFEEDSGGKIFCDMCNVGPMCGQASYRDHLRGKKHIMRKKLEDRKMKIKGDTEGSLSSEETCWNCSASSDIKKLSQCANCRAAW